MTILFDKKQREQLIYSYCDLIATRLTEENIALAERFPGAGTEATIISVESLSRTLVAYWVTGRTDTMAENLDELVKQVIETWNDSVKANIAAGDIEKSRGLPPKTYSISINLGGDEN